MFKNKSKVDMITIFGSYYEVDPSEKLEQLNLIINPSLIPMKRRWRNNLISSKFMGDYVTTFYMDADGNKGKIQNEISGSVSYVANELLENMMKYSVKDHLDMFSISVHLFPNHVLINGINVASVDMRERLEFVIKELDENDPGELFIRRMEEESLGQQSSGLGLITMLNDYHAGLSWKIESLAKDRMRVCTQVKIAIESETGLVK